MTGHTAERPALAKADDLATINDEIFQRLHFERHTDPVNAAARAADFIAGRLAERVTGFRRPSPDFGTRALQDYWDEVADSYRDTAHDIVALMSAGNFQDARCALAATLDQIDPDGRVA
jgi:hypothetical protein